MVKFKVGDFVRTNQRTYDSMNGSWLAPGTAGHITDVGPSDLDEDDFQTREIIAGKLEVFIENVNISPGVWQDRWEDAHDYLASYGVRLDDGRIVSILQREIEAALHPVAQTQMVLAYE